MSGGGAYIYIVKCADGSLYTGVTRRDVDERVSEHNQGFSPYTARRLPVVLLFSEAYDRVDEAVAAERRIKGWTRAKKAAYIRGDYARLSELAHRKRRLPPRPSTRPLTRPAQGEGIVEDERK